MYMPTHSETTTQNENSTVPVEFKKIIKDFVKDILTTFPEYIPKLNSNLKKVCMDEENIDAISYTFDYCKTVFPERFFDILYQNESIFTDMNMNTDFLPAIDFKYIWSSDISVSTKETIWKYLQLILFTLVGSFESGESFGDTAKMFESINENEFKSKLEETIGQMHDLFNSTDKASNDDGPRINPEHIPNPEDLHNHITGMLDGKLGKLAREIAEEAAGDLNLDLSENANIEDVFKQMMGDPTKLMGLVKNVGSKLDSRIKSGELKESELLQEAGEMMKKMKNMPGMENIQAMLSQMGMKMPGGGGGGGMPGMPNMGRNQKMDIGAFNNMMEQQTKQAQMRERIMKQAEAKQRVEAEKKAAHAAIPKRTEAEVEKATQELLAMEDAEKTTKSKTSSSKKKNKKV